LSDRKYGKVEIVKTTVEIPDRLFREAKEYAARHGVPMRAVVELGLRRVLEDPPPRRHFRLKTITTKGQGLACDADWSAIRSLVYEGHGG
jgi:hypothetical protein